jgi:coronin-7
LNRLIIIGSDVCDFKFDPFNNYRLATATEDGKIRLWHIPMSGLKQDVSTADETINAHASKCSLLQFHHLASDILLSASPEIGSSTIKLWNLKDKSIIRELGHPDNVI